MEVSTEGVRGGEVGSRARIQDIVQSVGIGGYLRVFGKEMQTGHCHGDLPQIR